MHELDLSLALSQVPARFESDRAYLDWELSRLSTLLDALARVANTDDPSTSWLALARQKSDARGAIRQTRRESPDLAFEEMVQRFNLSLLEEEILILALAQSLSEPLRHQMLEASGAQWDTINVGFASEFVRPTAGLILSEVSWCHPEANLIQSGLLHLTPPPGIPSPSAQLLSYGLQAPHFVAQAVLGSAQPDLSLRHAASLERPELEVHDAVLPEQVLTKVNAFITAFQGADRRPKLPLENWSLLIAGPRGCGKTLLARALASTFRRPLFSLDLERLHRSPDAIELLRRAHHNAAFFQSVLHLVQPESTPKESALYGPLISLIGSYPGLVLLEPRRADALGEDFEAVISQSLSLERPEAEERFSLWEIQLPQELEVEGDLRLADLSSAYELSGAQIARASRWAAQRATSGRGAPKLNHQALKEGARAQLFSRIGRYADRKTVRATLEDLILPEEIMAQVKQLLHACHHRHHVMNDWGFGARLTHGKGLVSLFTGEPGTGKTLCAEILAQEMGMQLDIVSIPKIVSKWVGETERNIQQIFAEARASDTVLLFDEADSLFAKRVKVERAQDHFQNMEVNMLLQEVERFEGIVLLTSNLEVNMDAAFQRRIIYKIDFPMPEAEQRAAIWERLIPDKAPLAGDVDFESLGEHYKLSGGQIKNAIITAAYESFPSPISFEALNEAAMVQARAAGMLAARHHFYD